MFMRLVRVTYNFDEENWFNSFVSKTWICCSRRKLGFCNFGFSEKYKNWYYGFASIIWFYNFGEKIRFSVVNKTPILLFWWEKYKFAVSWEYCLIIYRYRGTVIFSKQNKLYKLIITSFYSYSCYSYIKNNLK